MISDLLADITSFLFPKACAVCGCTLQRGEEGVCTQCLVSLPLAMNGGGARCCSEVRLAGKFAFVRATYFMGYHPGAASQKIVERIKYYNDPALGVKMGRIAAARLMAQGFLDGVDCIVPVPLHPLKSKKRGYNQSERIACGISQVSSLPVREDLLCRVHNDLSQTRKTVFSRGDAAMSAFALATGADPRGLHCLVVDDVLTTGSTMAGCCTVLEQAGAVISVFTLAAVE